MRRHRPTKPGRLLARLAAATGMAAAVSAAIVAPANATATCATEGHAYYIDDGPNAPLPGFNYMSGFEGDQRYGVFQLRVKRGDRFRIAGNGILPGSFQTQSRIQFAAVNLAGTSNAKIFSRNGAASSSVATSLAGSNCVVSDANPVNAYTVGNVPNGTYRIFASYNVPENGTTKFVSNEPVVDLLVRDSR
ncbi:hypothetical protein [Nonomuraea lactucae]|uniref:hypothetical protein n=1 Tax=Nonomuraea lactucae TaxID=2249762 RepID=UPI000DE20EAF|nr:hypothetical protein [Nonomuraea lactucae]